MKARELGPEHIGWNVTVNHVDGILKVVLPENGKIRVIAQNHISKEIMGIMLDPEIDVVVEKTLEMQIKENLGHIKNQGLGWLRKRVKK